MPSSGTNGLKSPQSFHCCACASSSANEVLGVGGGLGVGAERGRSKLFVRFDRGRSAVVRCAKCCINFGLAGMYRGGGFSFFAGGGRPG